MGTSITEALDEALGSEDEDSEVMPVAGADSESYIAKKLQLLWSRTPHQDAYEALAKPE